MEKALICDLQFFGGRGASSSVGRGSGAGGTFKNASEFEKSLTGVDDPRLAEYENTYNAESSYNNGLENNINRLIDEDGYGEETDYILDTEERMTNQTLKEMPENKTPSQLGEEEALKERLDVIKKLRKRRGEKAKFSNDISILYGE